MVVKIAFIKVALPDPLSQIIARCSPSDTSKPVPFRIDLSP
jgi:hypothetical protein